MPVSIEHAREAAIAAIEANTEALIALSKYIHANP